MSISNKSGGHSQCCRPCGCYKTNRTGTKKVSPAKRQKKTSCSCQQTFKVVWYYEPKSGQTNTGNSYINCGGPGPSPFEYWARAGLEPIGGPNCGSQNPDCCDCAACDDARRAALDGIRPDDTTATSPVQWYKEPGGESCSSCPNDCYHASFGNNNPNLPGPEKTANWSCNC